MWYFVLQNMKNIFNVIEWFCFDTIVQFLVYVKTQLVALK